MRVRATQTHENNRFLPPVEKDGIGSSTERANLDLLLDLMDLRRFFAAIVSGEEVAEGKPDPAIFLLAAKRLGVAPGECLVIEDAPVGIEAARRASMRVLAVVTTNPPEALSGANATITDLQSADVELLRRTAAR